MKLIPILMIVPAVALAGCDAAGDLAKSQLGEQARATFVERCEGIAGGLTLAPEAVGPACGCTADRLLEKDVSELASVDSQRIEEIVVDCADGSPDADPAGTKDAATVS